jgi:hypothetical protein
MGVQLPSSAVDKIIHFSLLLLCVLCALCGKKILNLKAKPAYKLPQIPMILSYPKSPEIAIDKPKKMTKSFISLFSSSASSAPSAVKNS